MSQVRGSPGQDCVLLQWGSWGTELHPPPQVQGPQLWVPMAWHRLPGYDSAQLGTHEMQRSASFGSWFYPAPLLLDPGGTHRLPQCQGLPSRQLSLHQSKQRRQRLEAGASRFPSMGSVPVLSVWPLLGVDGREQGCSSQGSLKTYPLSPTCRQGVSAPNGGGRPRQEDHGAGTTKGTRPGVSSAAMGAPAICKLFEGRNQVCLPLLHPRTPISAQCA